MDGYLTIQTCRLPGLLPKMCGDHTTMVKVNNFQIFLYRFLPSFKGLSYLFEHLGLPLAFHSRVEPYSENQGGE